MTEYLMTGDRTNWSVLWIGERKGKKVIIEHECGNDLTEAIRVYMLAKGKKPFATLRCNNTGFPPPTKYRAREVTKVVKKEVRGRMKKVRVKVTIDPMVKVNAAGFTWCPYCREMRKFKRLDSFRFEGIYVPKPGYRCFMCGIGTSNHHVRKHNPGLVVVAARTRTSKARRKK